MQKPGRKPSPRTYQLHPKVFPKVGEAIAAEAERLGVTQGQLIEQMWSEYQGLPEDRARITSKKLHNN